MDLQEQFRRVLTRPAEQLALAARVERDVRRDIIHLPLVRRPRVAALAAVLGFQHRRRHADEGRGQVGAAEIVLGVGG